MVNLLLEPNNSSRDPGPKNLCRSYNAGIPNTDGLSDVMQCLHVTDRETGALIEIIAV